MEDTFDSKKVFVFLLVFGGGWLAVQLFKPKKKKSLGRGDTSSISEDEPKDREILSAPDLAAEDAMANPMAEDAYVAMTAYVTAYNAKEPQDKLDELNDQLGHEMGIKIYRRRSDDKLVAQDLNGNDILVHNG